MRANKSISRAWPPRSVSAPPPPPGTRPARAGLRQALAVAAAMIFSASFTAAQEPAPDNKPVTYAGSEACQMCHEDIYKAFQKNPHIAVEKDKKRGWETRSCESCHGPGSKHTESTSAADIRNPAKLTVAEADKGCLTCHLNQPTHVGRVQNSHARNQ